MKEAAKLLISNLFRVGAGTRIGRYMYSQILANAMERTRIVEHNNVQLKFSAPNALMGYRIDTFSTKEPETLEWIDLFPQGSVVWDIGANVGLYTCYAAKAKGCRVFSFEPSVFNLELLARNIVLNGLTDMVTIVPLPLSDQLAFSKLNMTSTQWGGALSTFDKAYGHDGQALKKVFEFPTIGISMDDALNLLNVPPPDFIKIDVDGIEHLILEGGGTVLKGVKGVLVEIDDTFSRQCYDSQEYLQVAGLSLKAKRQAADFGSNQAGRHIFNQVWSR